MINKQKSFLVSKITSLKVFTTIRTCLYLVSRNHLIVNSASESAEVLLLEEKIVDEILVGNLNSISQLELPLAFYQSALKPSSMYCLSIASPDKIHRFSTLGERSTLSIVFL